MKKKTNQHDATRKIIPVPAKALVGITGGFEKLGDKHQDTKGSQSQS